MVCRALWFSIGNVFIVNFLFLFVNILCNTRRDMVFSFEFNFL